jgi:hypothetical protein
VAEEHEVVVDLVKSGTVTDTNFYGSYMYESKQRYSADGWFIVGDAADTVDPLYSLGLSLITLQATQIAEIIGGERAGAAVEDFAADLDLAFQNIHRLATHEITRLYESMHDGYHCHLRMHINILVMFHLVAPLIMNGYMWDPVGTRLFNRLVDQRAIEAELIGWQALIREAAALPSSRSPESYLKVQTPFSINYKYFEHLREEDIPASIAEMCFYLVRLRLALLRKIGWRGITASDQHLALLRDLMRAVAIRMLLQGTKPRDSKLLRRFALGTGRGPTPAPASTAHDLLGHSDGRHRSDQPAP